LYQPQRPLWSLGLTTDMRRQLTYSPANAKLRKLAKAPSMKPWLADGRKVYSIDMLSGWTCPFAKDCLSKVHVGADGKRYLTDGKATLFRCFSASQEAVYTESYNMRLRNFETLRQAKTTSAMVDRLTETFPKRCGVLRISVAGDIFNPHYFKALMELARLNPDVLFYAYTKSIRYWIADRAQVRRLDNFVLTASYGGRDDDLIKRHRLRSAKVVMSTYQARQEHLPIDHDDSHAADPNRARQSFALLIHGQQPKGSKAQKAVKRLNGTGSYTR
jgi:hypothetical protein